MMAAIAMLALGGGLLATGPAGATDIIGPDDPGIPACADFANMAPAQYKTPQTAYDVFGQPGSSTNPASFTFTAKLWSDVNADVDGAGNPACGDVTYALYLYASDVQTHSQGPLLMATSYRSNQETSPRTTFDYSTSWCPTTTFASCTFQSTPPSALLYYLTTTSQTAKRKSTTLLLDRAPDMGYQQADLNNPPGGSFH